MGFKIKKDAAGESRLYYLRASSDASEGVGRTAEEVAEILAEFRAGQKAGRVARRIEDLSVEKIYAKWNAKPKQKREATDGRHQ